MRKTWILITAAGLLLANLGLSRIVAADDKVPSIEDIMKKVNKKKGGLHSQVGEALKASSVDWDAVQKETKEYSAMADFLGKNDPPKGSKASWDKLSKMYATDAKALNTAADSKDKAAALASWNKLSKECQACHRAHRES